MQAVKQDSVGPGAINIPSILTPADIGRNLKKWLTDNKGQVNAQLSSEGALLLRGFKVNGTKDFENLISILGGDLLEYSNRSTPRTQVKGNVYTSTEYPPDEYIPLHNENSYTNRWARLIGFFSVKAADEGGETPIADSRKVYQRIDPAIREEFDAKEVMYVRNYGHLDLSWQEVFQTDDRSDVEQFCQANNIQFEWAEDTLKTWQICQATAKHPVSGEDVWFNQAHLFHVSNLPAELRDSLLANVDEKSLPRNAYFGDGTPLKEAQLEAVRQAYKEEEIAFPWQSGDIMLLDNMLFAHGRKPFKGQRKVLVGMTN